MTEQSAERINKKVSFRFCGRDLYFYLSMGLFSSFDIDTGTRHLLRALAATIDFSKIQHVLDAGCGTGVIAISLKKAFPHIRVDALDRDSLALEITSENAELNSTEISVFSGLDIFAAEPDFPDSPFVQGEKYDLITTNIPAKAGLPVLRRFFLNGLASLTDNGYFTVVIVEPLRETAINLIADLGASIVFDEHTTRHSIFFIQYDHSAGGDANRKPGGPVLCDTSFPGPYRRMDAFSFSEKNISYTLTTVFDVPGFDTIPISSAAAAELYAKLKPNHNTFLFWNPGQGHAAVIVLKKRFTQKHTDIKTCRCVLAGRDILSLLISYFNIKHEFPEISCRIVPVPGFDFLPGKIEKADTSTFDFIGIEVDIIPGFPYAGMLSNNAIKILHPTGTMVVSGRSSDIGRIAASTPKLTTKHSKKTKGFRAVAFSHKNKG
ncbi:MAG: methyltransferase [Spirochaetes bacterium]|nr:methyltransferase [Spirochaetota bacterium]MBL7006067.1 methyltransferase [Spirochaetia bacterium]